MPLPHKEIVLPAVDLSHDEGDPRWHAARGKRSTPVHGSDGQVLHYRWNGLHPGHYAAYWHLCVAGPWEETARAYEARPGDAFSAWMYADSHPAFWKFREARPGYPVNHVSALTASGALTRGWPEVTPHQVCPETGRPENDPACNTRTEWRFELGPEKLLPEEDCPSPPPWHDYALDGGGATYEEAILALARAIYDNYGNDRRIVDSAAWQDG